MTLPEYLEPLKALRVWVCFPLIWDEKKHNGFGAYEKPPINPATLFLSNQTPEQCGTYEEAAARVGQYIQYDGQRVRLEGVGLCLKPSGLVCVDLDSVAKTEPARRMTREAGAILELLNSYTELSPSGSGFHVILRGSFPDADNLRKKAAGKADINRGTAAEYQFMNSGYITITGRLVGEYNHIATIEDRREALAEFFRKYMQPKTEEAGNKPEKAAEPIRPKDPPKGTGLYTWERWQREIADISDEELLQKIYGAPRIGERVRDLYERGNISAYHNDHSTADYVLIDYLYGFTHDAGRVERLFKNSALYRPGTFKNAAGKTMRKSRNYVPRQIEKAALRNKYFIGTITPTYEERKAYAEAKDKEEREALRKSREARRQEREAAREEAAEQ